MSFVDHQQVGARQLHCLGMNGAAVQCLNRCNLHVLERASGNACLDNAMHDVEIAQLLTRLADDLAPMREHEHGFARAGLLADDLGPDDRLA